RVLGCNGKNNQPRLSGVKYDEYTFIMCLCKNDMVSIVVNEVKQIYRIQKLEQPSGITLRLHTAATLDNDAEKIRKSINTLISDYNMKKIRVNVIGKLM
ncbi:MAG: hypothetical protein ACC656_15025, partial [Candidatus Heimdallarchaeota archaeon]